MSKPADEDPLADPLLRIPPDEDAGALTQARYGFQWNCGVPFALQTLHETSPVAAVVCETHEDFVVLHRHGPELVSVKHRELTQPPWSLKELSDGAVGHLAGRWLATGRRARCRFMTNHELRPGEHEAGALKAACAADDAAAIDPWVARLERLLGLRQDDVRAFLRNLVLQTGLPGRDHVADVLRVHQLRPIMRRFGLAIELDVVAYGRILGVIARKSADRTSSPDAVLAAMVEPDGHRAEAVLRRRLAQRTIAAADIGSCLRGLPTRGMRLGKATAAPPPTRMVEKLEAGALGPTAVRSAQRLRAEWYALEARWRGLPGGGDAFGDLRARAQAIAAQIESEVLSDAPYGSHAPYGRSMHARISDRLATGDLARYAPFELDADLLLGLIYQLTDECEVWWSARGALP